jgi:hypothetical protein
MSRNRRPAPEENASISLERGGSLLIVGLSASAGGLDAFTELLQRPDTLTLFAACDDRALDRILKALDQDKSRAARRTSDVDQKQIDRQRRVY